MSGTDARPPTLMKMRGAVNCSSSTRTTFGDSNFAWPWKTVQFGMPRSHFSRPVRAFIVTVCARAFTVFMSMVGGLLNTTPYSAPRRARCAA